MPSVRHLLHRSVGAIALVLALAVLLGSLCPRGWFVCVHDHTVALAGAGHVTDGGECGADDCCPASDGGCLDLAVSLVLDDQTACPPGLLALPSAPLIDVLPDASRQATTLERSRGLRLVDPPLPDLIRHVRLLV